MKKYLAAVLLAGLFFSLNLSTLHAQVLSSQAVQKISNLEVIENNLVNRNSAPVIVVLSMPYQKLAEITPGERSIQQARIEHSQDMVLDELEGLRFQNLKRFNTLPYLSLQANRDVIERLAESPHVQAIIPDKLSRPMLNESTEIIGANIAWQTGYTGNDKTIVILDSGIESDHPALDGKIIGSECFSTIITYFDEEDENQQNELIQAKSLCEKPENEDEIYYADCDPESVDFCAHGTRVAGVVAGNGSEDIYGVAKDASIYSIQVYSYFILDQDCNGNAPCILSYDSDQISALEHIFELADDENNSLDFTSVNMSLGGLLFDEPCENDIRKPAIKNLKNQFDIPTIVSSGNDGEPDQITAPACISSAISVGSVTKSDAVDENFSNYAIFLDLVAPGVGITTSNFGGGTTTVTGTSFAAPHVAGAWALMKQAYPQDSVDNILQKLKDNAFKNVKDSRTDRYYDRIQIDAALSQNFLADIASDVPQQNEGWRLLSSPTITSYTNLLSDVWTQGPANSNAPMIASEESNILIFDGTDYLSVSDLSDPIPAGSGMAVYIFEDDNYDQTPNDWPKPLDVRGPPFFGDVIIDDELLNTGEDVFSLLGNPYSSAIKFEAFETSQIGNVVYVYDHSYEIEQSQFPLDEDVEDEDPGGGFRAWSESGVGSLTDGLIAPFQGFFVYATGNSPELTIPQTAIDTNASPPFYKEQPLPSPVVKLAARINGRQTSDTWFSFTENGSTDRNNYDAPMLYPLDYRPFLALHSEVDGTAFNIKNLPVDFDEPLRVPVNIQAWLPDGNEQFPGYMPMSGSVELIWPKLENIPPNWTFTLVDNHTGDIINLMEKDTYTFELDTSAYKISSIPYEMSMKTVQSVTDAHSRFTLNIHPFAVTDPFVDELPQKIALSQNYPNPFNPSTLINFELPETTEVILDIYSIDGQRVATLVNGTRNAGMHTVSFDGSNLASGIYLYRLTAAGFMQTRKMVLVK